MGVLIYFDLFERNDFRLFVATRVDRFYSSLYDAIGGKRTTTTISATPDDKTDILGILITDDGPRLKEEKLRKLLFIILVALLLAGIVACGFCCLFFCVRCQCGKLKSGEMTDPVQLRGMEDQMEDDSLYQEFFAKPAPVKQLRLQDVHWYKPKMSFTDTVMPFFVTLIGKAKEFSKESMR